jgi:cytochrome c oxidase cbb3-type subunit 3
MTRSVLAVALTLCSLPAFSQEDPIAGGENLFVVHCARCHGVGGTGGEGPSLRNPELRHAADDETLQKVIQEGIPGTSMPDNWMISLEQARQIAAYVRSIGRVEKTALPGDPENGRGIFEAKGGCSACHIVEGEGGILGPDLSQIGLMRGASYLRESLEAPGAATPPGYTLVEAVTSDGVSVSGVRVNEDSFTIQIRDERGRFHSLRKAELRSLEKKFRESLMPSYASDLTATEMDDLIAYLASLRGGR